MNTILTVFKKEMLDTLRDRRTLITAILMPAMLTPVLIWGVGALTKKIMEKEQSKKLSLAVLNPPDEFLTYIDTSIIDLKVGITMDTGRDEILKDSLDGMIGFKEDFQRKQEDMNRSKVDFWFKSTNLTVKERLSRIVDDYEESLLDKRITFLKISDKAIDPIQLRQHDIAPPKEQIGKTIGGILPYLFIVFCFSGCMYPALDLITGEKERGTIETLLTVPASRFKILAGKVLAIALVGLAAGVMGLLGLVIAAKFLPDMPDEIASMMSSLVSAKFIIMLLLMLIPLCFFFAGALTALVVRAKSFKEAQSIVSPFMMVVILPAALAMLPGIELNWKTAMVPILNIALATKEIVAGTIQNGHFIAIVISLVVLAIIAMITSYRAFSKEGMVLK